jgi:poly(hydroxyalkanoate) granule-associated protein
MVKKLESLARRRAAAAAQQIEAVLPESLKGSAQHIWLAGMGAFSRAQAEGGKVFEALIKEGLDLQRKTQGIAEEKINEVTGRMTAMADSVSQRAGQNWDRFESIFEQRTARALNRLGVPTAKDVDALARRVDELASAVALLSKATKGQGHAPASAKADGAAKARRRAAAPPSRPTSGAPVAPAPRKRAVRKPPE